jgi:hypothetical protein
MWQGESRLIGIGHVFSAEVGDINLQPNLPGIGFLGTNGWKNRRLNKNRISGSSLAAVFRIWMPGLSMEFGEWRTSPRTESAIRCELCPTTFVRLRIHVVVKGDVLRVGRLMVECESSLSRAGARGRQ